MLVDFGFDSNVNAKEFLQSALIWLEVACQMHLDTVFSINVQ